VLKARETWPLASRVFCAQDAKGWDHAAGLLEDVPVLLCRRRGGAIDLVLERPSQSRSQFVFTEARGRPAIWWQTQKTAQAASPCRTSLSFLFRSAESTSFIGRRRELASP
jgi:hypothetical protein